MNRAALETPFPKDLIRTRPGSFGREIAYVEASYYVKRLNEAFDGNWSWKIQSHEVHDTEVLVHGVLVVDGVERHAFGGNTITRTKAGEIVSVPDDLKAASTDALKKAASLLGLGLDLYLAEPAPASNSPAPTNRTTSSTSDPIPPVGPPATTMVRPQLRAVAPEPVPQDRNRLTAKQLRACYAIAHALGMSDGALKADCQNRFGSVPEFLDRKSASAFIDDLSSR